jgi:hypothetical protein
MIIINCSLIIITMLLSILGRGDNISRIVNDKFNKSVVVLQYDPFYLFRYMMMMMIVMMIVIMIVMMIVMVMMTIDDDDDDDDNDNDDDESVVVTLSLSIS